MAEHNDKQRSNKSDTPPRPSQAEGERKGGKQAENRSDKAERPSQAEGERKSAEEDLREPGGSQ